MSSNCDIHSPQLCSKGKTPLIQKPSASKISLKKNEKNTNSTISFKNETKQLPKNFTNENFNLTNSRPITYENNETDDESESDFDAMSVASRYHSGDNLEYQMDTERDFTKPSATIEDLIEENPINHISNKTKSCNCSCRNSSQYCDAAKCATPKIFFEDGIRSVDYVLVWDAFNQNAIEEKAYDKRKTFETNLKREGLQLEFGKQEPNGLNFVKIHVENEVLRRYSEILKLRMPMKEELCKEPKESDSYNVFASIGQKIPALRQISRRTNFFIDNISSRWDKLKSYITIDDSTFPDKEHRFTAIYSRDKEYLFDVDSPFFFTPAIRSRIVQFILDRKRFSESGNDFEFGIERLLNDKTYAAAYPLHDGDLRRQGSTRHLLYVEWASLKKWYKYQPLNYIKEYFGVKIGFYFAWLGFYTQMLIPAALVGLICFIYSCATLYSNIPSEDICNEKIKEKMCPLCDVWCSYWNISESCVHARITYLFDNPTTVFFAIFMSVWATLFMEMWKRYSAEITHRWDVTGFDIQEEHPRPQYLARLAHVTRKQVNVITNTMEPLVPYWKMRVPMTILSFSVVLLLIALALATVVAVVLYRMSILVSLKAFNPYAAVVVDNSSAMLFTTCTSACINLVFIVIFNYIYTYVAKYLTEYELLRTQTEFDDSLTLKIYLLQFVNYYASIFYIAFFKGRFVGYPKKYNRVFGYRQEECGPGGCLTELCIQLAIIMVGKQTMNTILEMLFPLFFKWLNTLKVKTGLTAQQQLCKNCRPQWVKDYKLVEWGPRSLFPEYLEMVLQYGFVTIFVAAFPLAPFFALINNILEMRLDAQKLLTFYRRPVSQRVRDIGVWYRILDSIGTLSVVTNGFIIAFTSEFIPRLVYLTNHNNLENYLNNSLSYFNTSDFINSSRPNKWDSESVCRYPDYREPPGTSNEYLRTSLYYQILAAKLMFVLVFENVVFFILTVVKWLIPDIPMDLRDQIRREAYITNEIIIIQETQRAKSGIKCKTPSELEKIKNLNEAPTSLEQWDRVLSESIGRFQVNRLNCTIPSNSTRESPHSQVSI
ncbi:anoctamin-5 isoform X2 [Diorhabda carinulata]|uniref:anoctamin-5 isoform X2 n=1 Tax=Diorhabda carinulata TaxID=1163345 RepID=UPI0025A20487|nr:anoctamin-5 isoform X2 [Diorhabda carinulata]